MQPESKPDRCRLCPPEKADTHTTREHVNQLMQAAGTGPSSVPDRVQKVLRSVSPDCGWSAIIHPQHPPQNERVWLAVMSPVRGYFIVSMADNVSDNEIRDWATTFNAAPS